MKFVKEIFHSFNFISLTRGEMTIHDNWDAKNLCCKLWQTTGEDISLAVLKMVLAPTKTFGQRLTSKNAYGHRILPLGPGGSSVIKEI